MVQAVMGWLFVLEIYVYRRDGKRMCYGEKKGDTNCPNKKELWILYLIIL